MRHLFVLLFLLLAVVLNAQPKRVVIETTTGRGVDESLKDTFMDALNSGLTSSGKYMVIANRRDYANKVQGEIIAQEEGYIDDNEWINIGAAHGAQLVIFSKINKYRDQYFITVNLIELESGVSKKTLKPIRANDDNIMDMALELAEKLSGSDIGDPESNNKSTSKGLLIPSIGCYVDEKDNKQCKFNDAVYSCEEKGEGWRLPTVEELRVIFTSLSLRKNLKATTYWTSEKRNNFSVYCLEYPSMTTTFESTSSSCEYRCVREK
ncbi:MAG: hypothetical protein SPL35_00360 [Bacteroidales bacterium]|nr:hypothetical protein [Bacteroidales bacterium]